MAELALAIVPLCLGAVKGINAAGKKLRVLRHYASEIKRLRKKFESETDIFLDECQLLFQEFLGLEEAEALIGNEDHPDWGSPQLDTQLRGYLGRRYEKFRETFAEIERHIVSLNESLGQEWTDDENHVGSVPSRVQFEDLHRT